ncbi:hypothetical protein LTR85_002753 [Meristemomyces frigidus]|nr:hypothetical protein LTR85_002753 [Meristemomyces frigidus]
MNSTTCAEIEVTDWDLSTRVLAGLDMTARLFEARKAVELGYFTPYPDSKVQHQLKTVAVGIYNHQKITPLFLANVTDGKNTIAYLLCPSYESGASPSPKKGERPKLRTSIPLPLGHWDGVWYALCAEVRKMYSSLQHEYGADFANGATILHNAGLHGASRSTEQPVSAIGLACVLEDMWSVLTDYRLITALDHGVRIKQVQDTLAGNEQDSSCEDVRELVDSNQEVAKLFHAAEGLLDVNTMTPDDIIKMVWSQQAAEARRNSGKSIEEQTLLAACRAEVLEAGVKGRASAEQARTSALCTCGAKCECRTHCDLQSQECPCAYMRNQVGGLVNSQEQLRGTVYDTFEAPGQTLVNNMLGAVSKEAAQMQIAALATPDHWIVQACLNTSETADKLDREILEMRRNRSNTNNSELAYVPPPRTPSRANKDAYPLGSYGDSSGQRYPSFRTNVQTSEPPVYGASSFCAQVPTRKPVPTLGAPPPTLQDSQRFWQARDQVPTPESSPLDGSFVHVGPVTYPSIPKSQSQGLFTQSFPAAAAGNPRQADTDTTVSAADYTCLAEEAHDAIRPFSDDPCMHTATKVPARPMLTSSATAPENIHSRKLRQDNIDLINKPQPPLPEPDFIAPRPATKQRYVSAGGNAKLRDREEIDGPGFAHTSSGATMNKDELFQKLNDPDFVKQNFGEAAVKMSMSAERGSQDSARSKRISGPESPRNSRDSLIKHDKRERTGSGSSLGSGRFVKLKRVFSRKNSVCE